MAKGSKINFDMEDEEDDLMFGGDDDFEDGADDEFTSFGDDEEDEEEDEFASALNSLGSSSIGAGGDSQVEETPAKGDNKKLFIIIGVSLIGLILVIILIRALSNIGKDDEKGSSGISSVTSEREKEEKGSKSDSSATENVSPSTQINNSSWVLLDGNDAIELNSEYKKLTYTVTKVNSYGKILGDEIAVKSIAIGGLSGLSGTYELEIPYGYGIKLKTGDEFAVSVRLGSFEGMVVVEDIKIEY